jgi:hypothetical protein
LYFYSGPNNETNQFATDSVKKFPQSAKLWFYLSLFQYELGHLQVAQEAMRKAVMLDAGNNQYRQLYQQLLQNQPFNIQKL